MLCTRVTEYGPGLTCTSSHSRQFPSWHLGIYRSITSFNAHQNIYFRFHLHWLFFHAVLSPPPLTHVTSWSEVRHFMGLILIPLSCFRRCAQNAWHLFVIYTHPSLRKLYRSRILHWRVAHVRSKPRWYVTVGHQCGLSFFVGTTSTREVSSAMQLSSKLFL